MHLETLLYDKSEGIATVTLNRPDRLNAINYRMNQELADVWGDIKQDQEIVVAVVTAAGDRSFCTGFDMAASADGEGHPAQSKTGTHFELLFTALQNSCWKPVITAVNGMVTGGGLHFIADSDLVIAAEHATFFDTHVRVGRPSVTEPIALARRMPLETIMRMVMLGGAERISAQRAYEVGMVGDVVPKERLMERARDTARAIMESSPATLMASKKAIWEGLNYGLHDAVEHGWEILNAHGGHPDAQEGGRAFAEKRKPRWAPAPRSD